MADLPDTDTTRAFVATYNPPQYDDPWRALADYKAVMDYQARNPDAGSTAIATALELPRGRVRPWLDGAQPDPVRGLRAATTQDWLPFAPESAVGRGLSVLVAWIYSGGSIAASGYVPLFAIDGTDAHDRLARAASAAGVELATSRDGESGRADELRPAEHPSVLGRVLAVLGAPVGEKAEHRELRPPAYLDEAPERVRREWVQTYLANRGVDRPEKNVMTLREERTPQYLDALRALFADVLDGEVNRSEKNLILHADAREECRNWPPVLASRA